MTTHQARLQFTKANAVLRRARDSFFDRSHRSIERTLGQGHTHALRTQAKRLQKLGIYSPKTSVGSVELSIMKQLYKRSDSTDWTLYCQITVGLAWLAA